MTSSHAMGGPQWKDFGWFPQFHDEYGDSDPNYEVFFHADGPDGFGVESPTDRDYGAVVGLQKQSSKSKKPKWSLKHVKEYPVMGASDADRLGEALDFMDITGSSEVTFDKPIELDEPHDLVKNLYDKRPNFPREFNTRNRAQHVAELLIKRRDANIPLTPRPKQGK